MKQIFYFIVTLLLSKGTQLQAQTSDPNLLPKAQNFMQSNEALLAFEENKGQIQGKDGEMVRFTVKAPGIDIFILKNGIAYQYKKVHYPEGYATQLKERAPEHLEKLAAAIRTETFRMDAILVGANQDAEVVTEGKSEERTHYYNHDAIDVAQYQKVVFKNIYPLIDWQLLFKDGQLEYEFVVHPGGNPELIRFRYNHTEGLTLQKDGSLQLQSKMGNISDQAPVSFQNGNAVSTAFLLEGKEMRFKLGPYDKTKKLIIDPALVWATYYGGGDYDYGNGCTTDNAGNVYLAGNTRSTTNIADGGHQNTYGGDLDAFLVKFNSSGTRLWATYYGGTASDDGQSCATDAAGNIYLTGHTRSSTGMSENGHQNTIASADYDAFLVKFNSNGTRIWGTYYGGTGGEYVYDCVTDAAGNVYIAGRTTSTASIASSGHQNGFGGIVDAFLVKFNSNGVRQWGTYYGGTGLDYGFSCATDAVGAVYLSGYTNSSSGIGHGGHQMNLAGPDAFLVKFNTNGVRQWGTYYGGSGVEEGLSCATDANGNVYLSGYTSSTNSIASGGHQNTIDEGTDAFLVKFNSNGLRQWGTYYGGADNETAKSCITDIEGNVYISGDTKSLSGIAFNGMQNVHGGGNDDAFLSKFNSAGNLQWGSYFGGESVDYGSSCATDALGHVYLVGHTQSITSIASGGHHNTHNGGIYDAFLSKFSSDVNPVPLTLTHFGAIAARKQTHLSWSTAKEVNVQTISVERSNEKASEWETIAVQNAKGALQNHYEEWDHQPLSGINLYRLKITDIDGTFTHSAVRKVYFAPASNNNISIYPNPNKGTFTIELNGSQSNPTEVLIIDALGRSVYHLKYESSQHIISDLKLNAGVYLVSLHNGDQIYTQKMIVE